MNGKLKLVICLGASLATASSMAQTSVAHVYVASVPGSGSAAEIYGYAADAHGTLTPLPGSPFQENDQGLAVSGTYLFGINGDRPEIDSFAIDDNGGLSYTASRNYTQYNPNNCGAAAWLFPDRTGANLYDMEFLGDCSNNGYQSFSVNQGSGSLQYLGYADGGAGSFSGVYLPLTFSSSDAFAYEATNNDCMYFSVWTYRRDTNGDLASIDANVTMPAPPSGYRIYIPTFTAADSFDHVAIAMQAANPPGCSNNAPQLGIFSVDQNGNLTTTNTSANMPSTDVVGVTDMKVAPGGPYLAVAGTGGLQVFHINGADPPTQVTPLLTQDPISQMFWDKNNHIYAISQSAGRLHVFTVTSTGYKEDAGSPYTISNPQSIAVQSLH
jgi:hypothetical protein